MNHDDEARLRALLQKAFDNPADAGPQRDLWPAMLCRLDQARARRGAVPAWVDWTLAAAATACLAVFPRAIPLLLFHL